MEPKPAILLTIPISHYCERARWALHLSGISFVEKQHLQMFHWPHAYLLGGRKFVPIFKQQGEKPLVDSAQIVQFAHDNRNRGIGLYPSDAALVQQVKAIEKCFAGALGVEGRRLMYWHFFEWGKEALTFNGAQAPLWERQAFSFLFPVMKGIGKRYLGVNSESAKKAKTIVDSEFDAVAKLIEGKQYLVGDQFTAADLTFACMAAAVIAPELYGVRLPQPHEMPDQTARMIESYRNHPAGRFALSIYERHHYHSKVKMPE